MKDYDKKYRLVNNDSLESYHQFLQSVLKRAEKAELYLNKQQVLKLRAILNLQIFEESKGSKEMRARLHEIGQVQNNEIIIEGEKIGDLRNLIRAKFQTDTHLVTLIEDLRVTGKNYYVQTNPYDAPYNTFIYSKKEFEEEIQHINKELDRFGSKLEETNVEGEKL